MSKSKVKKPYVKPVLKKVAITELSPEKRQAVKEIEKRPKKRPS